MSVREPWDETDEGGTVTFATVQTVSKPTAIQQIVAYQAYQVVVKL